MKDFYCLFVVFSFSLLTNNKIKTTHSPHFQREQANLKKEKISCPSWHPTKEPIKETKTEQIPIMHEELVIEQRPFDENSQSLLSDNNESKPVETNTQINIPIKREEVEVTKKAYVIEELVVKKKAVTKTQTISEEIITETVNDPQVQVRLAE